MCPQRRAVPDGAAAGRGHSAAGGHVSETAGNIHRRRSSRGSRAAGGDDVRAAERARGTLVALETLRALLTLLALRTLRARPTRPTRPTRSAGLARLALRTPLALGVGAVVPVVGRRGAVRVQRRLTLRAGPADRIGDGRRRRAVRTRLSRGATGAGLLHRVGGGRRARHNTERHGDRTHRHHSRGLQTRNSARPTVHWNLPIGQERQDNEHAFRALLSAVTSPRSETTPFFTLHKELLIRNSHHNRGSPERRPTRASRASCR